MTAILESLIVEHQYLHKEIYQLITKHYHIFYGLIKFINNTHPTIINYKRKLLMQPVKTLLLKEVHLPQLQLIGITGLLVIMIREIMLKDLEI